MRRMIAALITLTVLPISAVVALPAPAANAFCNRITVGFAVDCDNAGHNAITEDALGFLSPFLVGRIVDKNTAQDGERHHRAGQSCISAIACLQRAPPTSGASTSRSSMRSRPQFTLMPDTATATMRWGQLLHPVQDFYSHSSWVDPVPVGLGFGTTHAKFLLDAGLVNWRSIRPYAPLFGGSGPFSDILAVEGGTPPDGVIGLPQRSDRTTDLGGADDPADLR